MKILRVLLVIGVVLVAAGVLYSWAIRPWHVRWGATEAEIQADLPGDELAPEHTTVATRAITIRTPANQVWPWLVQIGQGRGGMFSYDGLENLVGCDIHTLNRIVPALQELKAGDEIRLAKYEALPRFRVVLADVNRALVLRSVDSETGEADGGIWAFVLEPVDAQTTRLIVRHREGPAADGMTRTINAVFDPISFFMEQKMMRTLRDFSESLYEGREIRTTVY